MFLAKLQQFMVRGKEFFPHVLVMGGRVVFCPVVCVVEGAGSQVDSELVLVDGAVAEPVESHVHCLRAFWLHLLVDDAFCC